MRSILGALLIVAMSISVAADDALLDQQFRRLASDDVYGRAVRTTQEAGPPTATQGACEDNRGDQRRRAVWRRDGRRGRPDESQEIKRPNRLG